MALPGRRRQSSQLINLIRVAEHTKKAHSIFLISASPYITDENRLITYLTEYHYSKARPVPANNQPLQINVTVFLRRIQVLVSKSLQLLKI